jgi:DNA ligase-associated metallophosphoesterase
MMIEALTVDVGGHALMLSAARAAFDPVLKTLFIADAHFGKDAVFRARGIPVPEGSTAETLARLNALISMHRPASVIFLGDLLHAKESHASATLRALAEWRVRHASLRLILVEGNHDRHAGGPPETLGMEVVDEPYRLGPWALCHYPQRVAGAFALGGHEHPVYRVATRRDSARLPCFRFAGDAGVLPAFGAFTGGYEVNENARNERIFVVAGERVMAVRPPMRPQSQ